MSSRRKWALAALLALPALTVYAGHWLVGWNTPGVLPTGFVQYDMASYMAEAREYFDRGDFSLLQASPYSDDYANQAMYFRPHILVLGLLWRATGLSPGAVFGLFGIVAMVACMRLLVEIYARRVGLDTLAEKVGVVLLAWGGGLLWPVGVALGLVSEGWSWPATLVHGFDLDPAKGWWFLNLGRNLLLPLEAYYHAIFLGTILAIMTSRWKIAIGLAAFLSLSHVFTGLEIVAIVGVWAALERFYLRNPAIPVYLPISFCLIAIFHLAYHLVWLNQFAEHRQLLEQARVDYVYSAASFLPAYALVGALAVYAIRTPERLRSCLADPFFRLCAVWTAIAFLLANHEFAFPAQQPLHFTRGYIWLGLALLGLEPLVCILRRAQAGGIRAVALAAALCFVLLIDNAAFLVRSTKDQLDARHGLFLTGAEARLLEFASSYPVGEPLFATNNRKLSYLSVVLTPHRAVWSHWSNTPDYIDKRNRLADFFQTCRLPEPLRTRELLVVQDRRSDAGLGPRFLRPSECDLADHLGDTIYDEDGFRVWHVAARPTPAH